LALLAGTGFFVYKERHAPPSPRQRTLTRVTFGDGLQFGATWSPDGRFIAYNSDRGGKFDIWVQQVSGGDPIQVTKQPLGGAGLERRVSSFGYFPRWSPT
jgi:Tol biopolymer transport system component